MTKQFDYRFNPRPVSVDWSPQFQEEVGKDFEKYSVKNKILVAESGPEALRRLQKILGQFEIVSVPTVAPGALKRELLHHPDCALLMVQKNLVIFHRDEIVGTMELLVKLGIPVMFHEKFDLYNPDKLLERVVHSMGLWAA